MKQIKTISYKLEYAAAFDDKVNEAIREGWKLTKREVLMPKAQSNSMYTSIMLYAELEQEIITERERCCENCAHFEKDPFDEPCNKCEDEEYAPSQWEPRE